MTNRLEILRNEKDLKSIEMAKELNVVKSVYSEWENNKLNIPTERLYNLAEFFEVNIDYLVGVTNTRKSIKTNKKLNRSIVCERLKLIRKELNLSMRALANILNTTSSAISNYENNKYLILSSFLIEIANTYNYSIDWILGRTNKKKL